MQSFNYGHGGNYFHLEGLIRGNDRFEIPEATLTDVAQLRGLFNYINTSQFHVSLAS
jgi:hypothetical protein